MARIAIQVSQLETVAAAIRTVVGVKSVAVWDKVSGRETLYIDLVKHNGGASWCEGIGHTFVLKASENTLKRDERRDWAGAKTRTWHGANDTMDKIREAINSVVPETEEVALENRS